LATNRRKLDAILKELSRISHDFTKTPVSQHNPIEMGTENGRRSVTDLMI
jgi:hypothetical protein